MWVRTQLKIGWSDLCAGLFASFGKLDRDAELTRAEAYFGEGRSIATFSVRSGFDLLLRALALKPGDEVVFTALNVRAMVKVVKEQGMVPVPVDIDLATMGPRLDRLEAALTPSSKVFVAAHLFGSRIDLDPAFELVKQRGLLAVEDCAQAFNGRDYEGSRLADVVMYSFGPIKTATALGGGLLRVRDPQLLARMLEIQSRYPVQSETKQRKRIVQFMGLKLVTMPWVLGLIHRFYAARGMDYEDALADRVRDVAPLKTANKMRQQCSATLLLLMNRRLSRYRGGDIAAREAKGRALTALIGAKHALPAQANAHHDYWVYPLLPREPKRIISALRANGFDASGLPRSQHIAAPLDRPELEPKAAATVMRDIVIVPCYADMPDGELKRQAAIINQALAEEGGSRGA
jgi:perosamine synthetase